MHNVEILMFVACDVVRYIWQLDDILYVTLTLVIISCIFIIIINKILTYKINRFKLQTIYQNTLVSYLYKNIFQIDN